MPGIPHSHPSPGPFSEDGLVSGVLPTRNCLQRPQNQVCQEELGLTFPLPHARCHLRYLGQAVSSMEPAWSGLHVLLSHLQGHGAAEKGLLHLYYKIVKAMHADCTDSETHSKALENYPPEGTPFFGSKRAFLGIECYLSLPVIV